MSCDEMSCHEKSMSRNVLSGSVGHETSCSGKSSHEKSISQFLPKENRKTFYYIYVLSNLLYSFTVWGRCSDIGKLEKQQKDNENTLK